MTLLTAYILTFLGPTFSGFASPVTYVIVKGAVGRQKKSPVPEFLRGTDLVAYEKKNKKPLRFKY